MTLANDFLPPTRALPPTLTTVPGETEITALPEPRPKLRIWASYPEGSSPEAVDLEYDGDAEVTADFIAGVIAALARRSASW